MTELDLSKLQGALKQEVQEVQEVQIGQIGLIEQKFQHYSSSRPSMQLCTTTGKRIGFIGNSFITADQECIDYLDAEIKAGIAVVTKGELLTSAEADPMEQLKAKHIEEYLAAQEKIATDSAKGVTRDMGSSKSKEAIDAGAKPMSTAGVVAASDSGS